MPWLVRLVQAGIHSPLRPVVPFRLPLQSLVALLWALATLRAGHVQPVLRGVSQILAGRLEACQTSMGRPGSQAGASSGSSSAATDAREDGDAGRVDGGLSSSQLCTAVWACGQLRHGDPGLLAAACGLLLTRVQELGPGDTAR